MNRITEAQLRRVIKAAVRTVLREALSYRQLINLSGIDDIEEWNLAAETEHKEELQDKIWE